MSCWTRCSASPWGRSISRHLLSREGIDGNLFYAWTAYNSGPARLREWQRKVDYRNDPLLFIESIPSMKPASSSNGF